MSKLFPQWFILSAGAILAITGVAKLLGGFGDSKLLAVTDPIIGVQFRHLMSMVGLVEIAAALLCFFNKRHTIVLAVVAWLSTNFLVYRLGIWAIDWKSPCGCLGTLTDALQITPQVADNIMKVVLAYLLFGSYFLLIRHWLQNKSAERKQEFAPVAEATPDA